MFPSTWLKICLLSCVGLFLVQAHLAASDSVSLSTSIRIQPAAVISLPDEVDFSLIVPPEPVPNAEAIQPLRIPFSVRGNALATVSATPTTFLRIDDGKVLGRAVGPQGGDDSLGYDIVVQFPATAATAAGSTGGGGFDVSSDRGGYARLPGNEDEGTPDLTVDAAAYGSEVPGVILVVARQHWTEDGRDAAPGVYTGSFTVTAVPDKK